MCPNLAEKLPLKERGEELVGVEGVGGKGWRRGVHGNSRPGLQLSLKDQQQFAEQKNIIDLRLL